MLGGWGGEVRRRRGGGVSNSELRDLSSRPGLGLDKTQGSPGPQFTYLGK